MSEKLRFDNIQCGCGAKLNTCNSELIAKFDEVHGSAQHQAIIMEIKLIKAKGQNV